MSTSDNWISSCLKMNFLTVFFSWFFSKISSAIAHVRLAKNTPTRTHFARTIPRGFTVHTPFAPEIPHARVRSHFRTHALQYSGSCLLGDKSNFKLVEIFWKKCKYFLKKRKFGKGKLKKKEKGNLKEEIWKKKLDKGNLIKEIWRRKFEK